MTIGQKMMGIGKRVLAQTAMSATVMTGLHFASVADFPPTRWVFGPGNASEGSPAGEPARAAAGVPAVRIVALPARPENAAGPVGPSAPAAAADKDEPVEREQEIAMVVPPKAASCGRACPPDPRVVAHPTPRPDAPKATAERRRPPATLPTSAPQPAPNAPILAAASMALPVPDDIPTPPPAPTAAGFDLADLIPGHHAVMQGVSYVGGQARDAVAEAASGALDLVRR